MKNFLSLISICIVVFSHSQCNTVLYGCEKIPYNAYSKNNSYYDLLENPKEVECLTIRTQFFKDTLCANEIEFNVFTNLSRISIDFHGSDSVLQQSIINKLKSVSSLKSMILGTTFRLDYHGFDSLEKLRFHQFFINTPSISSLNSLEEIILSTGSFQMESNDPLFSLKNLKTLRISETRTCCFPFESISKIDSLQFLDIYFKDVFHFYDSWNNLKKLEAVHFNTRDTINISNIDINKLENLRSIQLSGSYYAPILNEELFGDTNLVIDIFNIRTGKSGKKEIKKLKHYAKIAEKKYNRNVTFITGKKHIATSLRIEGVRED